MQFPTRDSAPERSSTAVPTTTTTAHSTTRAEASEPDFICTLCWQEQHRPSRPKLLGSSARIVCYPCWSAILNLSICWVCGECVVSLGWCFWHRGCFGCLVCGTRMAVPGVVGRNEWGGRGVKGAVELESIPLCECCAIETAGEKNDTVLQRGLDTVSRFDGGLSRCRMDMLREKRQEGKKNGSSGTSGHEQEQARLLQGSSRLCGRQRSENHADIGIIGGNGEGEHNRGDDEVDDVGKLEDEAPRPEVYVSLFDPIRHTPFKASKTKPLPKWMSLLPSSRQRRMVQHRKGSSSEPHSSCKSSETDDGVPISSPGVSNSKGPMKILLSSSTAPSVPIDIPESSRNSSGGHSTVPLDPKAAGIHEYRSTDQQSQVEESVHMTPPEYPSAQLLSISRTTNHRLPSSDRNESATVISYSSTRNPTTEPFETSCCGLGLCFVPPSRSLEESTSPLGSKIQSPSRQPAHVVAHSSEYLDRYQPKASDAQHSIYVAKEPEHIINKIKRQAQNLAKETEGEGEERRYCDRGMKLRTAEHVLDPKREDLRKELRNLFCEEE